MARGPRTKHSLNDFGTRRSYDQSLPHKYATHFDVYVRRDSYAEWLLQYQLEQQSNSITMELYPKDGKKKDVDEC